VVNFHIFYFHTDHKHNISFKAFSFVEQIKPCIYFRWQDHIVSSLYWFFSCWSIAAAVILMMNAENHLVDLTNQLFDSHFNSRKTHRINVLILHFVFIVLKIVSRTETEPYIISSIPILYRIRKHTGLLQLLFSWETTLEKRKSDIWKFTRYNFLSNFRFLYFRKCPQIGPCFVYQDVWSQILY
jgi:hypothetical protein